MSRQRHSQIIDESNKVTEQICVTQDKKQELYTGREIIKKELQGEWVLVTAWGALYDAKIFKELRFPCGRHICSVTLLLSSII